MGRLLTLLIAFFLQFGLLAQQSKMTVQGRQYKGNLEKSHFVLLNSHGDTVLYPGGDYYMSYAFRDFNQDGNKDVLLEVSDNTPGRYELFLYSPKRHKFKEVKGFYDFATPVPIKGTRFYYSYNRAGCADNTWESYLFYIENYKPVKLGYINGEGCGNKDEIYIYRQRGNKKALIKTLPLKTIEEYKEYKWGFFKSYWTKYYRQFI
jgi:hypothetical protein